MRGDPDRIIKEVLRQGPKTPKELSSACLDNEISKSSYYRCLRKLIKKEEIKEAKYELIEKVMEADREEVDRCITAISKALINGNKNVLSSRIDELRLLSERNRIAHFPRVLMQIKECLESSLLVYDFETFKKLVVTLSNILGFEQYHKPKGWDRITERIQNEISPEVISVIMEHPEFPDSSAISFLGEVGTKEAVIAIFDKIRSKPSEAIPRIDTARALAKIYSEHGKFIDHQLDALLENEDPRLIELAKKYRREMSHQRSILKSYTRVN